MNPPNHEPDPALDRLLRAAAADPRPAHWAQTAARGLEARVLARLARRESWAEAIFGLATWRPLFASAALVAAVALWAGHSTAQLWDDEWMAGQADTEELLPEPPGMDEIEL